MVLKTRHPPLVLEGAVSFLHPGRVQKMIKASAESVISRFLRDLEMIDNFVPLFFRFCSSFHFLPRCRLFALTCFFSFLIVLARHLLDAF